MIQTIIQNLENSPAILKDLISKIPEEGLKLRRIPGKWSIHEHACHLADVQPMLYNRFVVFKKESAPVFKPFLPGTTVSDAHLIETDLGKAMDNFDQERKKQLDLFRTFKPNDWYREATHPEYQQYTPEILLRHLLMHDHFHMYRIEELWLTKDAFLRKV